MKHLAIITAISATLSACAVTIPLPNVHCTQSFATPGYLFRENGQLYTVDTVYGPIASNVCNKNPPNMRTAVHAHLFVEENAIISKE